MRLTPANHVPPSANKSAPKPAAMYEESTASSRPSASRDKKKHGSRSRNNINRCAGIVATAAIFIGTCAFAGGSSTGSRDEGRAIEMQACCYPLLAINDSEKRARNQAEFRRREYQRRQDEKAEANRHAVAAQEQRMRETARHALAKSQQQAAERAREERKRRNAHDANKRKEICNIDTAVPKIGMTLAQVQACFGRVQLVGQWHASDDSVPGLIYRAGRYHLFVMHGRVVDWY